MKKKYLYLLLRVLVYLLVLGAILYGLYESPYNPHPHSAEDIRRWVVGFGVWAPLIYVAVYTIRPLLLFPTLLLNLSAGVLFGPWWGILFLLLGGFGCASFCYLLGRFGGGSWLLLRAGVEPQTITVLGILLLFIGAIGLTAAVELCKKRKS